ncbi:MAG: DUF1735 domain-containing protein [Bacteroidota bacterium]|nr:DUF1735 domain-containing protein [Bacteroidota bacterium]
MQIKNKAKVLISGLILFGVVLSLSSCLKNGKYYTDFSTAGTSVNLPLAAANLNGLVAFSYDASVSSVDLPVFVDVASPSLPSTSTSVTLALDTAFLSSYNTANGTSFEVLPDSVYSTSGWTLTVPAGKRLDSMNVHLNFSKLDLSGAYVLPITIAQSSVPIEQWKHLLLYISVKNQWDGKYGIHVSISGSNAYAGTVFDDNVSLATSGVTSVAENDIADFFGGYTNYTFNPDGSIGVFAGTGPGSGSYGAVVNASSYDANTHNFHVNYSILSGKYIFDLTYTRQ